MLRNTGALSSTENSSSRVLSMPLAAITAPSEPPTPVTSRISPVVWKPEVRTLPTPSPSSPSIEKRTMQDAISRPMKSAMLASPRNAITSFEAWCPRWGSNPD
jgi:hypothetical protein